MTFTPYPFQRDDLDTLKKNNYVALVNIQTGGGKSLLALWAAIESGAKQKLIIAPQNTHQSAWGKTLKDLTGEDIRVVGNKTKAQKEAKSDLELGYEGWYIVTPQLMGFHATDISSWMPDFLISDEIHTYNKSDSKSGKRWMQLGQQAPMKLALSGTPVRRDFTRMWTNARHLWPELQYRGQIAHSNQWAWRQHRMVGTEIYTSQRNHDGTPKKVMKWESEAEPGKLLSEAPCVIQHFRRDNCCKHHPTGFLSHDAPTVIERVVPLLPKQKRIIRDLEESYMAWLDDQPMVVDLSITQKLRIRQACLGVPTLEEFEDVDEFGEKVIKQTLNFEDDCESPVTDEILDILEHLDEDEPVLIHIESQRFASVLVKRLTAAGYPAAEYSGKTVKEREDYLTKFGKSLQVIVGVTSALANGTNGLQEVCSVEIYAETHIDDTLVEQSQARLDRLNSKGQVVRYVLVDDLGYSQGQLSSQLAKRLAIRQSTRKV